MSIDYTTDVSHEPPKPSFDDLPLSEEVRQALVDMEYAHPTPVQTAVWEPAANGRDVVVQARTGTGKTAAFGLPLVDRTVRKNKQHIQALVLCPTRELALQVSRELVKLGARKEIGTVAVYGGAPMPRQIEQLRRGAHIVVGTPGRVLDHMRRGTFDPSHVRALVLDECDEMLSMGFERELTAIIDHLPEQRQTLLFSATIPPDIERMARNKLRDPEFVILSSDRVGALEILHYVYWVTQNKLDALVQIIDIDDPESAIVFCNTKKQTETVASHLRRHGFESDWLNGDLPQADREKVMKRTREGRCRFLVATDVAARGIDISHLTHVINFDFPLDAEGYVHRTGRTGRAGRTGTALSLVAPAEVGALYILRLTYKIRPIERQLPNERDQKTRREADIVQSLADTFAPRGSDETHRALARRLLCHDDAESIVAGILRAHMSTTPELPELSESRRRGRTPDPVPEPPAVSVSPPVGRSVSPPVGPVVIAPPVAAAEPAAPVAEPRREARAPEPLPKRRPPERRPPERRPPERAERADRADRAERDSEKRPVERASPFSPPVGPGAPIDEPPASPPPARASAPVERRSARESAKVTQEAAGSRRESADERDESGSSPGAAGSVELHVDAGRRDGARVRMFKGILADAGIAPESVRRVRVRDTYCFIEVDVEVRDAALEALNGASLGPGPTGGETSPSDSLPEGDEGSALGSGAGKRKLTATISERSQTR